MRSVLDALRDGRLSLRRHATLSAIAWQSFWAAEVILVNSYGRSRRHVSWVPAPRRFRAALQRGARHIREKEFFPAYGAFGYALDDAEGAEHEFVRGLRHLAAAGYKHQRGDERGARRQLEHAKRRLAPFGPRHVEIDVDECLEAVRRLIDAESSSGRTSGKRPAL